MIDRFVSITTLPIITVIIIVIINRAQKDEMFVKKKMEIKRLIEKIGIKIKPPKL